MRMLIGVLFLTSLIALPSQAQSDDAASGMGNRQLACRIALADTDGDGALTVEEITARKEAVRAHIDSDGDGEISRKERRLARKDRRESGPGACSAEAIRFQQIDANSDGQISSQEFAAQSEKIFGRLDRNGDGVLQQEELRRLNRGGRQGRARQRRRGK